MDESLDHDFHEFESLEETNKKASMEIDISTFIEKIKKIKHSF
jgi:hypothetical protein